MKTLTRLAREALVAFPMVSLVSVFLLWPALTVVFKAFFSDAGFRLDSISRALSGTYQQSFLLSTQLSMTTAIIGGVIGFYLAVIVDRMKPSSKIRSATQAWSAVASQMGGVPLAFAFFAILGTQGIATHILRNFGIDLTEMGLTLSSFWGWVFVYLYFQVPLMFLIVSPALSAMKPSWKEGATSLGASDSSYWLRVALPILFPVLITGALLLFVNAFTAYATVYALSSSGGQLVPLQIRFILQGNVITGEEDLGYALVTVTMALLALAMISIQLLQKRFARWLA